MNFVLPKKKQKKNRKGKGGSQNKSNQLSGQMPYPLVPPTEKPFLYFYVLFFGIFHISILVFNGLLKQMMNIMIKLLLLLLKSQRFCSVVVGKGLSDGWRWVHGATVFLREMPCCSNLQTRDFFWNKKIFKQSPPSPSGPVFLLCRTPTKNDKKKPQKTCGIIPTKPWKLYHLLLFPFVTIETSQQAVWN